ncbi:MAG: hypothetical protein AAGA10_22300 [Bacteroidota bacterium]
MNNLITIPQRKKLCVFALAFLFGFSAFPQQALGIEKSPIITEKVSPAPSTPLIVKKYFCAAHNTEEEKTLLREALTFWNGQSEKFAFRFTNEAGAVVTLPISFELALAPGTYTEWDFFLPHPDVPTQNLVYLEVIPDERLRRLDRSRSHTATHAIGYAYQGTVAISQDFAHMKEVAIHEIGHILGAQHARASIMDSHIHCYTSHIKRKTIHQIITHTIETTSEAQNPIISLICEDPKILQKGKIVRLVSGALPFFVAMK